MEFSSAKSLWDAALGELQLQVSKCNFKTWLEKTSGLNYNDNEIVIAVPNTFIAEYLDKNQRSLIEKTVIGLLHKDIKVSFMVKNNNASSSKYILRTSQCPLNSNYTFESFIIGNCNQLAHHAAFEVAEHPGQSYNPLFICGGPGLGKTHLLQAIGHLATSKNMKVVYVNSEQYVNEFITSVRENNTEEIRSKYRSAEMLLLDDIQFLSGKPKTEESVYHLLSELQESNRQVVVTSDRFPKSMPGLNERLRSRLEGGLIADVRNPDFDTRLAILKAKAENKGAPVDTDILELIAQRIQQNIRELEGSLNRVIAYARLVRDSLTTEIAERALENIGDKAPVTRVTPNLLIEAVATVFDITPIDLRGKKRDKETALARQVAVYVMKKETGCSLSQIGKELGGRNPATITHAYQKIAGEIDNNPYLKEKVSDIQRRLRPISI